MGVGRHSVFFFILYQSVPMMTAIICHYCNRDRALC